MKHLIKKENNIIHGTLGWSHKGNDGQYCEAGETVRIKWQPNAGWGLKEVHYTDGDGNVVAIEGGEFVMPDSAIVIGATFKRFFLSDWEDNPYNPHPQPAGPKYLTFTAGEGGANVGFIVFNDGYEIPETYTKPSLQYSSDGGKTWQDYDLQISDDLSEATLINLNKGENVMFKGVNENLAYYLEDDGDWFRVQTYIEGSVAASGDVTSLLNGIGGDVVMQSYCCRRMFSGCTGLTTPPNLPSSLLEGYCYSDMFQGCTGLTAAPILPATTLAANCYNGMFQGCTGLTQAPELPATTMESFCYSYMFSGCTGLTQAPALPATTLANGCYNYMFSGCTGLTTAPSLPATTLANGCYDSMFSDCTSLTSAHELPATTLADSCYVAMFHGCTGLTQAPALPATTLVRSCYQGMFGGCTALTSAPALPATTLANGCYSSMFSDCTGITSHDVATLNNSTNTFNNNSSCASFTIHADTPPTIANNTITGLKADCIIYVPAASVDAYKAKQYWSARAAYIQAIQ